MRVGMHRGVKRPVRKQQLATMLKIFMAALVVVGIGLFQPINSLAGATTDASTTIPDLSTSTTVK